MENVKRTLPGSPPPRLGWKSGLHACTDLASSELMWPGRPTWQGLQRYRDLIQYTRHSLCIVGAVTRSFDSFIPKSFDFLGRLRYYFKMLSSLSANEFIWKKRWCVGLEEGENRVSVGRSLYSFSTSHNGHSQKKCPKQMMFLFQGLGPLMDLAQVLDKYVLIRWMIKRMLVTRKSRAMATGIEK